MSSILCNDRARFADLAADCQDLVRSCRWIGVDTLPPPALTSATSTGGGPPIGGAATIGDRLIAAVDAVIAGKHDVVEVAVATLLSGGHLLIEDLPGVGKTLLAQAVARAAGSSFNRIQGTSDLLPGDITGTMVPDSRPGLDTMTFRPGPIFANVVVFDELNRATPRTQSALLELAEEATVTVDGRTHPLPDPFMIVATQNPIDVAGTYALGEGALDRFRAVVMPGRPAPDHELQILTGHRGRPALASVAAVTTIEELAAARAEVTAVEVSDVIGEYVVRILQATREHPRIRLGASTRGGVAVVALARAFAALRGRHFVTPDDVVRAAVPALAHRIGGPGATATAGRELVADCLAGVAPPSL